MASPDDPTPTPSPVSRRSFLRASALTGAAAALPLSAAAAAAEGDAPAAPPAHRARPVAPADHWVEPAVWDVRDHGDRALPLTVLEVAAPTWLHVNASEGGSPTDPAGPTTLYTYNGSLPGPTVRMGGTDTLRVELINGLGGNNGLWAYGNGARFATERATVPGLEGTFAANDPVPSVPDWMLSGSLLYGPHMQRTTNLHTHGLHVRPGMNPNGTHSDNVMLRVIPNEDYRNRMQHDPPIPLHDGHGGDVQHVEVPGSARYEFQLGPASDAPPHPPGTHWYHPHPHGATYDQVVGGMAGFLIVEGDVDEALAALYDADASAPATPSGPWDYRERLMLFQRVFDTGTAPIGSGEGNEGGNRLNKNQKTVQTVNGQEPGTLGFTMKAGAVERWRVLNGSVDGNGFVRIVVADANATLPNQQPGETGGAFGHRLDAWVERHGVGLTHVAFDGVTLVALDGTHTADAVSSLELGPANRADVLFQAPQTAGTFTVWGVAVTHRVGDAASAPTEIATVTVTGRDDAPPAVPVEAVRGMLAEVPVPDHLRPVSVDELRGSDGAVRTRRVIYSGWGGNGYPSTCTDGVAPPDRVAPETPPPGFSKNTMAISRVKYDPDKPVQLMGLDTAEEWVLDNFSVKTTSPGGVLPLPDGVDTGGAVDHPFHMHQNPFYVMAILRPEYTPGPDGTVDLGAEPTYVNVLPRPRWQDVVPIPADGGRVVFRSRFPDYHGFFVNHCHILQHEDWGMMQAVEVVGPGDARTPNPDRHAAPYDLSDLNGPDPAYPKPTVAEMIDYCQTFLDLDGAVARGGVIEGGTPMTYCPS